MDRTALLAIVTATILVNSGCATMLGGTLQEVTIKTDPPDATVIIDGQTRLPGASTVELRRGIIHELRVEHPGQDVDGLLRTQATAVVDQVTQWKTPNQLQGEIGPPPRGRR